MIEEAFIDCDEAGFRLVLTGDFVEAFADYLAADPASRDSSTVRLRLTQDAALELAGSARSTIIPWSAEHDEAEVAYRRHRPVALAAVRLEEFAGVPDGLVEAADLSRKAARENA